jgi:hypothetical protein
MVEGFAHLAPDHLGQTPSQSQLIGSIRCSAVTIWLRWKSQLVLARVYSLHQIDHCLRDHIRLLGGDKVEI